MSKEIQKEVKNKQYLDLALMPIIQQ